MVDFTIAARQEELREIARDFAESHLSYLVERYGADHLLLGTDYPYDMAEPDPVGLINGASSLTQAQKDEISGGNAAQLLGIVQHAR